MGDGVVGEDDWAGEAESHRSMQRLHVCGLRPSVVMMAACGGEALQRLVFRPRERDRERQGSRCHTAVFFSLWMVTGRRRDGGRAGNPLGSRTSISLGPPCANKRASRQTCISESSCLPKGGKAAAKVMARRCDHVGLRVCRWRDDARGERNTGLPEQGSRQDAMETQWRHRKPASGSR